jgi:hypothetical protein
MFMDSSTSTSSAPSVISRTISSVDGGSREGIIERTSLGKGKKGKGGRKRRERERGNEKRKRGKKMKRMKQEKRGKKGRKGEKN